MRLDDQTAKLTAHARVPVQAIVQYRGRRARVELFDNDGEVELQIRVHTTAQPSSPFKGHDLRAAFLEVASPAAARTFLASYGNFKQHEASGKVESLQWSDFLYWQAVIVSWPDDMEGTLMRLHQERGVTGAYQPSFKWLLKPISSFECVGELQMLCEPATILDALLATLYVDFWSANLHIASALPHSKLIKCARKDCVVRFREARAGKRYCSNLCASKQRHFDVRAKKRKTSSP